MSISTRIPRGDEGRYLYSLQNRQSLSAWASSWFRPVAIAIGVCALVFIGYHFFQKYLSMPVTIILLAIMLAYLLHPIVERMAGLAAPRHVHLARAVSVLLLYIAIGFGVYTIGAVTAHTLRTDTQALQATWAKASQLPQQFSHLYQWYQDTVPADIQREIGDSVQREAKSFIPGIMARLVGVAQVAVQWFSLLIEMIFVPLVAFYLLTDAPKVREQLLGFVPSRFRERVVFYGSGMDGILRRYVIGQLILCGIAWIVVTLALLLMGVPGALLLGVIAGISRAIPVIGPLVGGVPVVAAVLIDNPWPGAFWWVLIGFVLLHLFESKVLMPRILGDKLGIHPVLIIISLLIGYELLGLLGMFIAPPAVAMILFILQEHERRQAVPAPSQEAPPAETDTALATVSPDMV